MNSSGRPRIELAVQGSIRIQSPKSDARLPAHIGERAAHQNLSIRLHRQAYRIENTTTTDAPRIEGAVQRPVGIQPPKVGPALPAQRVENAAHQNLPVRLDR